MCFIVEKQALRGYQICYREGVLRQSQKVSSISASAASAHQQHQRISSISSISSISAAAESAKSQKVSSATYISNIVYFWGAQHAFCKGGWALQVFERCEAAP